ncbi:unnamed protein product [Lactuca virosa]|uniref:Uncharacterized protein n=1 Tax=Lactuca virosa TaxID=75947 RepID=A0AAU9M810_9ASTR|nr:unnamed protein product [Lactuca virosa]
MNTRRSSFYMFKIVRHQVPLHRPESTSNPKVTELDHNHQEMTEKQAQTVEIMRRIGNTPPNNPSNHRMRFRLF